MQHVMKFTSVFWNKHTCPRPHGCVMETHLCVLETHKVFIESYPHDLSRARTQQATLPPPTTTPTEVENVEGSKLGGKAFLHLPAMLGEDKILHRLLILKC